MVSVLRLTLALGVYAAGCTSSTVVGPHGQQGVADSASSASASAASFSMTDRCGGAPSGHPTMPMPPSASTHGVEIIFGDYNITACNNTAWTFRGLWHKSAAVLTPTGFAQVRHICVSPVYVSCIVAHFCSPSEKTVTNVNLPRHPCPGVRDVVAPEAKRAGGNWTQCDKIFGCAAVGLLEGGATPAQCEAKCASMPNCTAFNVRMVHPGGCSLRNCATGTVPHSTLADFAGYANYPIKCDAWKPPPPGPPPGPPAVKPCPETITGDSPSQSVLHQSIKRWNVF